MTRAERARAVVQGLYPIVDVTEEEPIQRVLERLRTVAVPGVRLVQLRAKRTRDQALHELAVAAAGLTRSLDLSLIVNDRADIAAAAGAGVHLGSEDLPLAAARRLLGPDALIGRSTDTPEEAREASHAGADYVAWGAVWPTSSKADAAPQEGPAVLAKVRAAIPRTPLVAIGGINLERVALVRNAGADAFAVIGALRDAKDAGAEARALVAAWEGA